MKARSALAIQRDVIFAIFLRDLKARFSGYALGTIWILLEPILMILMFMALLGARGMGEFGYAEPPVFIMAGILAFRLLWQPTQRTVATAYKGFRPLRSFRQISLFDLMTARALVQLGIYFAASMLIASGLWWFGFDAMPNDPLDLAVAIITVFFLSVGVGFALAVPIAASPEIDKMVNILQMPLFLISSVVFPMTIVPPEYHDAFAINPLVHMSEWVREAWIKLYVSPVLDRSYLASWALGSCVLGMIGYRLGRHRILIQ